MPLIGLATQQDRLRPQIEAGIAHVLAHGQYILCPEVPKLEAQLADYTGAQHCITYANGTDALQIAFKALGVGNGDEVITPGFTYITTAEAVAFLGAKVVYVDIDSINFNVDPRLLEAAITPRTKAISPVSLYDQCAEFDAINEIASRHGIPIIEDAAQSFGGPYKGKKPCTLTTIAYASFSRPSRLGAMAMAARRSPLIQTSRNASAKSPGTAKKNATTTFALGSIQGWIRYKRLFFF